MGDIGSNPSDHDISSRPEGPFGAALAAAGLRSRIRRPARPQPVGVDAIGPQTEAVIRAWLQHVDYEPPVFLAAWEQPPTQTIFLLKGFVSRDGWCAPGDRSTQDAGGRISFAAEDGWPDSLRGLERTMSASVLGPGGGPRLRASRFAHADGALIPVGSTPTGVLHLPLLGPPLAISGPAAAGMLRAMVTRAALRLGKGGSRALAAAGLGGLFEATVDVQPFPEPATMLHRRGQPVPTAFRPADALLLDLLPEIHAREDAFQAKHASSFVEHALMRRGPHLPVVLLGYDRRGWQSTQPIWATDPIERGIAAVILGEHDQAPRRLRVSQGRLVLQLAGLLSRLVLRPALLGTDEQQQAAVLLATQQPPLPATGLAASIEHAGFVSHPPPANRPQPPPKAHRQPAAQPQPNRPVTPATPDAASDQQQQQRPTCRIYCLGSLRIEVDGQPVHDRIRLQRSRELLALLVANPHGVHRDVAIETLWPPQDPDDIGPDPKRSARNLDTCVSGLNKHLGKAADSGPLIERVNERIQLRRDQVWIDAVAFGDALKQAEAEDGGPGAGDDDPAVHLKQAVSLYQGKFCQDAYRNWSEPYAKHLQDQFVTAAQRLATILGERGEVDTALELADRAIAAEERAEHLYRLAMRLEHQRGRRDQIVKYYRRLEKLLAELGTKEHPVRPSQETINLYRSLTS